MILRRLERKIAMVPPWRRGETREERIDRVAWHRRNIVRCYMTHRKAFDRLGISPTDYFKAEPQTETVTPDG